jgi:hypothetical protein
LWAGHGAWWHRRVVREAGDAGQGVGRPAVGVVGPEGAAAARAGGAAGVRSRVVVCSAGFAVLATGRPPGTTQSLPGQRLVIQSRLPASLF